MRIVRLLVGTLLGAALTLPGIVPTAAAAPELLNPRLSAAHTVAQTPPFQLSPDGTRVVYAGGIDDQPRRLFSAPTDGSAAPVAFTAPSAFGRVGAFTISPDGSKVVYLYENAPAADQFDLYSAPLAGGASVKLSGPLPATTTIEDFTISPDGSRVVYRADVFADGEFELFEVPITGGAPLRLNTPPVDGGSVKPGYRFSPDGSRIVYTANLDDTWLVELYASRLDMSGSRRLSADMQGSGDVREFTITNDNQVVYSADHEVDEQVELYRVSLLTGPPQVAVTDQAVQAAVVASKLSGPLAAGASVKQFQLSPNGQQVVYRADAEQPGQDNLYRVSTFGGQVTKLHQHLVAGGNVAEDFALSPDSLWVVYRADQHTDGINELFVVPIVGAGPATRLNTSLVDGGDVVEFAISPDSRRVVYRADQQTDGDVELYSRALPVQSDTPPAGDGQVIVPPIVKLNGPLVANGDVFGFAISPGGDRVVYRATQDSFTVHELYNAQIAGGSSTKLNGELVAGGNALEFRFSADGSRVVYRADQATDETHALFAAYEPAPSATIAGPAGPLPVGAHAATLTLSQPLQLAGVHVKVDTAGGDAVPGTDFLLPATSAPQAAGTPKGEVIVAFAPGEKSKALPVQVLANAERTEPRTLRLSIIGTAGVTPGNPASVDLTLAKYEAPGSPPSSPPGSPSAPPAVPPGTHRTLLPLAQR